VVSDDLAGVFFGGFVVAEPGVAGRGVEDPLCVIEHEVVLGVFGPGELLQQFGSAVEVGADLAALAEPGPAACFLQDELNHGVAYSGELLSGAGVVDHVGLAALGEGEPGGHLAGPGRHLAAAGLLVSVPTVRWLRQEGRFAPAIKVGRRLVWDACDLAAWLESQREAPKVA
jgi:hypothetical protein